MRDPIVSVSIINDKKNEEYFFMDDNGDFLGKYSVLGDLIHSVYVSRKHRGEGLCKKMMKDATRRYKKLILHVRPNNTAAIKWYEGAGFKKKELIKNFYDDFYGGKPENILLYTYGKNT